MLRRRGPAGVANIIVAIANVNLLFKAVMVIAGPGFLSC
jgi:hypothetical protein